MTDTDDDELPPEVEAHLGKPGTARHAEMSRLARERMTWNSDDIEWERARPVIEKVELGWPSFVRWARQFSKVPTFDQAEIDYKRVATEPLRGAAAALAAGTVWLPLLKRGFTNSSNNLVSHWAFTPFLTWVETDEEAAAEVVRTLWNDEVAVGERLDAFGRILPAEVIPGHGSRCNLASYLLASHDLQKWPVYRVTAFKLAADLARFPALKDGASLGRRYVHAVEFLDQFILQAAERDLEIPDRLHAQSLLWCVTKWQKRPPNFDPSEWEALLEFRSEPSQARRTRRKTPKAKTSRPPLHPLCPLCGTDDEVTLVGPAEPNRWTFVCEVGRFHDDPYEFETSSR